jgi:hypothetical protein
LRAERHRLLGNCFCISISARDPEHGINVALFTPAALAGTRPVFQDPWLCELTAEHVRFHSAHGRQDYYFPLELFSVDGELPWPT